MTNKRLCLPDGNNPNEDQEGEESQEKFTTTAVMCNETDRCPICLNCLLEQEIGYPENCNHVFCMSCILKWAEIVPFCPVDRKPFQAVYRLKDHVQFQVKQKETTQKGCSCNKNCWTSCFTANYKCCKRKAGIGSLKAKISDDLEPKFDTAGVQKDEKEGVETKIFHSTGKSLLIFYKFRCHRFMLRTRSIH